MIIFYLLCTHKFTCESLSGIEVNSVYNSLRLFRFALTRRGLINLFDMNFFEFISLCHDDICLMQRTFQHLFLIVRGKNVIVKLAW